MNCFFRWCCLSLMLVLGQTSVFAQAYPDRAVKIIVPFPPGGPVDTLARILSEQLGRNLKQTVIIENRPGAGGSIGAALVARAAPDGYTFLMNASSFAMDPAIRTNLPFDPLKDIHGVTMIATGPMVLLTVPNFSGDSVSALVRKLKDQPNKFSYASAGIGTANQFAAELFKKSTETQVTHIPYAGAAPATKAILSGEVELMFNNVLSSLPLIQAGRVKAVAVASAQRWASMPEVPTLTESGYPDVVVMSWYAMFGPANIPSVILDTINGAVRRIVEDPQVKEKIAALGLEAQSTSPGELQEYVAAEIKKWTVIAREAQIKSE